MISDSELMQKLSVVFRHKGFSGASLADLAAATNLKRASLYHRFPEGKSQMAMEVLIAAKDQMMNYVLAALREDASAEIRISRMTERLNSFYLNGEQGCFLNVLASNIIQDNRLASEVKLILGLLIGEIEYFLQQTGFSKTLAQTRAQRIMMLLQGSLVMCRGMQSSKPFQDFIKNLKDELLKQ